MRDHADSRLLARSTRALGADVPHPTGAIAQRMTPGEHHGHGGRQSVAGRTVSPGLQSAIYSPGRGARHRVCALDRDGARRSPLCPGRTGRGQGPHGARSPPPSPDPARPAPVPLCEGHGARARVSGGTLAVFHGPRCWARYQADGQRLEPAHRRTGPTQGSDTRPIVACRPTVKEKIERTGRKLGGRNTGQSRSDIHRTT